MAKAETQPEFVKFSSKGKPRFVRVLIDPPVQRIDESHSGFKDGKPVFTNQFDENNANQYNSQLMPDNS